MIPVNINLWDDAKSLFPIQFYEKPVVTELIKQYVTQLQISNDQVFDIIDNLNVNTATGYLLDCVGSYVAVSRNFDDDETYRARIKRRALIASSEGTPNQLLDLLSVTTEGATKIWEHYPVSASFSTNGLVIPSKLALYMQEASPATSGNVIVYLNPFNNCFIPSELGFDVLKLANENRNPFITNNSEYIVVNSLIYGGEEDEFSLLSEFTYGIDNGSESYFPDGLGILCEISYTSGGVTSYNHSNILLDGAVNDWWIAMNYTVPFLFTNNIPYVPTFIEFTEWVDTDTWNDRAYWRDGLEWDDGGTWADETYWEDS
jgi:hypothetical protein